MTDKDRPDQRPLAKPTVQLENARVIVTEWRFPPGAHTGWHKHMHDYVVVPVTTGELHIFDGKQTVPAPLRAGVSYARQTGVEHDAWPQAYSLAHAARRVEGRANDERALFAAAKVMARALAIVSIVLGSRGARMLVAAFGERAGRAPDPRLDRHRASSWIDNDCSD